MSILFTLYCLLGIIFMGVVIKNLMLDNVWQPYHKRLMVFFALHTLVAFFICWISYSASYYFNKKRKGGDK